jgi:hypothetical protein
LNTVTDATVCIASDGNSQEASWLFLLLMKEPLDAQLRQREVAVPD